MFKRALLILTVAALMMTGCNGNGQQSHQTPPPFVIIESVQTDYVRATETFVGKIDAVTRASITARVNGYLESIRVTEGDFVKKNQVIFTIERDQYLAAFRQAEGALEQAEASARNTALVRERSRALYESESISRAKYDDAVAADDIAKATVASARASLQTAKLNLEYTEVRSPIDGRVGLINYNIGETVGPSSGVITTVIAPDPMYVLFNVSDKQLQNLRSRYVGANGDFNEMMGKVTLKLLFSNGTEYQVPGKINFIDNAITGATDSIRLRGEFANPSGLLTQGQTVSVTVMSDTEESIIVIPQSAIIYDVGGKYVLVVGDDKKAVRRAVEVGAVQDGGRQVVFSGLSVGENIIVDGAQKVQINAEVTPMTREQYNDMIQQQTAAPAGASEGK